MANNRLRFLNSKWNDSISNNEALRLEWNHSLSRAKSRLGLFKVLYPRDGIVEYELVLNLTDSIDNMTCWWTPHDLRNELYALWLAADNDHTEYWAVSPPWLPKHDNSRVAPFIVSVVCILSLYAICVASCLLYRRRQRRKEPGDDFGPADCDSSRSYSIDSTSTEETLSDRQGGVKERPDLWVMSSCSLETAVTCVSGALDDDVEHVEPTQLGEACIYDSDSVGIGRRGSWA